MKTKLILFLFASLQSSVLMANPNTVPERDSDAAYEYYRASFLEHQLPVDHPLAVKIADGLAESFFLADQSSTLKDRVNDLRLVLQTNPELIERLIDLSDRLDKQWQVRLAKAKRARTIYSLTGAAVAAVIAIPTTLVVLKKASWLSITIPVSIAAGGSVGFLLGNVFAMPQETYDRQTFNREIDEIR